MPVLCLQLDAVSTPNDWTLIAPAGYDKVDAVRTLDMAKSYIRSLDTDDSQQWYSVENVASATTATFNDSDDPIRKVCIYSECRATDPNCAATGAYRILFDSTADGSNTMSMTTGGLGHTPNHDVHHSWQGQRDCSVVSSNLVPSPPHGALAPGPWLWSYIDNLRVGISNHIDIPPGYTSQVDCTQLFACIHYGDDNTDCPRCCCCCMCFDPCVIIPPGAFQITWSDFFGDVHTTSNPRICICPPFQGKYNPDGGAVNAPCYWYNNGTASTTGDDGVQWTDFGGMAIFCGTTSGDGLCGCCSILWSFSIIFPDTDGHSNGGMGPMQYNLNPCLDQCDPFNQSSALASSGSLFNNGIPLPYTPGETAAGSWVGSTGDIIITCNPLHCLTP